MTNVSPLTENVSINKRRLKVGLRGNIREKTVQNVKIRIRTKDSSQENLSAYRTDQVIGEELRNPNMVSRVQQSRLRGCLEVVLHMMCVLLHETHCSILTARLWEIPRRQRRRVGTAYS